MSVSGFLQDIGKKALAALLLVGLAYLVFKVVIGTVIAVFWVVAVVVALVAVVWAVRQF